MISATQIELACIWKIFPVLVHSYSAPKMPQTKQKNLLTKLESLIQ